MAADRRSATFPNVTFAVALLNPDQSSRHKLIFDEIQRARSNILRFAEVPDDVINTNHVILEKSENTPQSSAFNLVDALFRVWDNKPHQL